MTAILDGLGDTAGLKQFLNGILSSEFVQFAADHCQVNPDIARATLAAYVNEVMTGLDLMAGEQIQGKRILEVGAGIGALSLYLSKLGAHVTAIEPSAGGFDLNVPLFKALQAWTGASDVTFKAIGAQDLNPKEHGKFDLVFSVNVMEHIPDLEGAFRGMTSVLSGSGKMVHLCPNYWIPYEPHFGLPLVPFRPAMTAAMAKRVKGSALWQSLNFITPARAKRVSKANGLAIEFKKGLMYDAFQRLDQDPAFRDRHIGLVSKVYGVLTKLRLLPLLKTLPPAFATPMQFTCTHQRMARP